MYIDIDINIYYIIIIIIIVDNCFGKGRRSKKCNHYHITIILIIPVLSNSRF